jgi:hypothetical protein
MPLLPSLPKKIDSESISQNEFGQRNRTQCQLEQQKRLQAELLTISAFGGLEVQVSGLNNGFNVPFGTELICVAQNHIPFILYPGICP